VKNKTALKRSIASAKFLSIAIAVMLVLTFKYPSWYAVVVLVVLAFYLQMDIVMIVRIRREGLQDPTYLDLQLKDKHGRTL
jgi:ABC-type transport system involved in Fe-S cluster assembly fused permease/ATPase subunit